MGKKYILFIVLIVGILLISFLSTLAITTPIVKEGTASSPTNLSANVISKTKVNLSWIDNSINETSFFIERATNNCSSMFTKIYETAANAISYSDTNLSANTSYCYRIRAYNSIGKSAYSNTALIKTPGTSPTPTPTSTLDFYVSPTGNDNNLGTIEKPFKTLEKARDIIREIKKNNQFTKPINVYLRAGAYNLDETFELTSTDSGKANKEISYLAYPDEIPIISGGKKPSLSWQLYKNNIYSADVSNFINQYGEFNSLLVNYNLATRSRTPNDGSYFRITDGTTIPEITLEAEDGKLSNYIIETDGTKKYAIVPSNTKNESSFNPNAPSIEFSFDISQAGYYLFSTNNFNDSDGVGSIYVQIDKQVTPDICSSPGKAGNATWQWRNCIVKPINSQIIGDYSLRFFSQGTHTLKIFHKSNRIKFDAFKITQKFNTFEFSGADINSSWKNLKDVEIVFFQSFYQSRSKINGITNSQVQLQQSAERIFSPYPDPRYFVENILEGIDSPGEWYLDKTTKKLYYWPLSSENIFTSSIIIPHLKQLLKLENASYLNFKNIIFANTDWQFPENESVKQDSGVKIQTSNNISFINNTIGKIGGDGLEINNSTDLNISRNKINNIGGAGITGEKVNNLTIDSNIIKNVGKKFKASACILVQDSRALLITQNEISLCPFNGIQINSILSPAVISKNIIYQAMTELNDGGGIYTNRVSTEISPAVEISNNIIHDILPTNHQKNYLSFLIMRGIYLDSLSKNYLIKNNLIYRTNESLKFNSGSGNIIKNNILVDGGENQIQINSINDDKTNEFINNIVVYTGTGSLFDISKDITTNHGFSVCNKNIYFNADNLVDTKSYKIKVNNSLINFNEWRNNLGLDTNSLITNPLFVNPTKNDFRLKSNSPAFNIGFQNLDMTNVGPEKTYFQSSSSPTCNNITDNECINNGDNVNDAIFCQNENDCVYNKICYPKGTYKDLNADDKIDGWCAGYFPKQWRDCDGYQPACISGCNAKWVAGGESTVFGEYNTGTEIECCGDDKNEYFITTDDNSACCDNPKDTVNNTGKCISKINSVIRNLEIWFSEILDNLPLLASFNFIEN